MRAGTLVVIGADLALAFGRIRRFRRVIDDAQDRAAIFWRQDAGVIGDAVGRIDRCRRGLGAPHVHRALVGALGYGAGRGRGCIEDNARATLGIVLGDDPANRRQA